MTKYSIHRRAAKFAKEINFMIAVVPPGRTADWKDSKHKRIIRVKPKNLFLNDVLETIG